MTPQELLAFIRTHRLAVQASVTSAGAPQAALVGFAVTDAFELVFDTLAATRKVTNLRENSSVALVIGGWVASDERTLQIDGVADEPQGADHERIREAYFTAWPDGRARQAWPGLTYVRVRPTWIRYSDFNQQPPLVVEFSAEQLGANG
jgi:general stress protein 26